MTKVKTKRYRSMQDLAESLGLPASRGLESEVKAALTKALIQEIERNDLTHQEVADLADVSRTTVTGIINGSLQKITIDRLLRLLGAVGLGVEVRVKRAG